MKTATALVALFLCVGQAGLCQSRLGPSDESNTATVLYLLEPYATVLHPVSPDASRWHQTHFRVPLPIDTTLWEALRELCPRTTEVRLEEVATYALVGERYIAYRFNAYVNETVGTRIEVLASLEATSRMWTQQGNSIPGCR